MQVSFVIKKNVNQMWKLWISFTARALRYGDDVVDDAKACGKCSVVSE